MFERSDPISHISWDDSTRKYQPLPLVVFAQSHTDAALRVFASPVTTEAVEFITVAWRVSAATKLIDLWTRKVDVFCEWAVACQISKRLEKSLKRYAETSQGVLFALAN